MSNIFHKLYLRILSAEYGSSEGNDVLERQIALYNSQSRSERTRVSRTGDFRQFIVKICLPLIKRVHACLKLSG